MVEPVGACATGQISLYADEDGIALKELGMDGSKVGKARGIDVVIA